MLLYPNTLYSWDLRFWIVVSRSVIKSITGLKFYFTLFIHLFNIYIFYFVPMPLSQFFFSNGWILTWLGTRLTIMAPRLFTWVPERSGHQTSYCTTGESMNPFHTNISVHILYTSLHTVLKALTRRNCLTIKSVLSWWSLPFSWWF